MPADPDLPIRIRRLRADEGMVLRDLRLRGLSEAPEAFGQSADDAAHQPDEEWRAAVRAAADGDRRAWLIAERIAHDGTPTPVGVVLGRRRPPETLLIFSMWVDPAVRRTGVGRRLIGTLEDWARGWGGRSTVLWVFGTNEPAIRFYGRLGFRVVQAGPDATAGTPYGALAMSRPITGRPAGREDGR